MPYSAYLRTLWEWSISLLSATYKVIHLYWNFPYEHKPDRVIENKGFALRVKLHLPEFSAAREQTPLNLLTVGSLPSLPGG